MHKVQEICSGKGAAWAEVLATLPEWFGIPEANAMYVRTVEDLPCFAAYYDGSILGFLAVKVHTPFAAELYVIGVKAEYHRNGIGRELISHAERYLNERNVSFFTVKTLSPSLPDPRYAETRRFYEAMGFVPIEEFPTRWSAQNPALMMAKVLTR
jgi:ribosomal protein S18 acetylase RimI-like enzyme